jgi:hypothetical protein
MSCSSVVPGDAPTVVVVPTSWRALVEELRQIRRAVEAGAVVQVEGAGTPGTWQEFYAWAHGRYHMLEDGCDPWIGDDKS